MIYFFGILFYSIPFIIQLLVSGNIDFQGLGLYLLCFPVFVYAMIADNISEKNERKIAKINGKFCIHCGRQMQEGQKFCTKCGNRI